MHPSHFYTSSSQGWEKCLVKVSFKSAHIASFGRAVKKCVKIAYFCTPDDCYEKFITCLVSIAKKNRMHVLQICCFNRHSNLQSRMNCGPRVIPHHTALMPRWSDHRQHFGHRLISRKLTLRLRCGVVASLARPIPIGLFPSGYVEAKAFTCP